VDAVLCYFVNSYNKTRENTLQPLLNCDLAAFDYKKAAKWYAKKLGIFN